MEGFVVESGWLVWELGEVVGVDGLELVGGVVRSSGWVIGTVGDTMGVESLGCKGVWGGLGIGGLAVGWASGGAVSWVGCGCCVVG